MVWPMMHWGEKGERGGEDGQPGRVVADGRVEGEGGGEEGLELLLPQLDGKRACQGVEQTWLAIHLQQKCIFP